MNLESEQSLHEPAQAKRPILSDKPPQALSPHGVERVVVGNKVWQSVVQE